MSSFLGSRAVSYLLLVMGCSAGLSLAIGFAVRALAIITAEGAILHMQPAEGDPHAEEGSWDKYLNFPEGSTSEANSVVKPQEAPEVSTGPSSQVPPHPQASNSPTSLGHFGAETSEPVETRQPAAGPSQVAQPGPAPAPPQAYHDDSNQPLNLPNGYWEKRRIIKEVLKADLDTRFDRPPSYRKYQRVFELVVGPDYKSQARLVEVLADIANNPANNPTIEQARRIMNDIYQRRVKDKDLDSYEFDDNDDPLG